jgi:hypothetical protein
MDNLQLLITVNAILVATLGFFIRGYMKRQSEDHKELKEAIEKIGAELLLKADKKDCKETHEDVEKLLHKHATQGSAGEVIWL